MLKLFRDRIIIAACLMLYALGMTSMTLSHAHATVAYDPLSASSITYNVLCSGDLDGAFSKGHCPFCRLGDVVAAPMPLVADLQTGWAFAAFQVDAILPHDPKRINTHAPPRAPPVLS